MQQRIWNTLLLIFATGLLTYSYAQVRTSVLRNGVFIEKDSFTIAEADYEINGARVQLGDDFSQMTPESVSAGNLSVRSEISEAGFSMLAINFFPNLGLQLNYDQLTFSAVEDSGFPNFKKSDWVFGVTSPGAFDDTDALNRGFYIDQNRQDGDLILTSRVLFINPDHNSIGINRGSTTTFSGQLSVETFGRNYAVHGSHIRDNGTAIGVSGDALAFGNGLQIGTAGFAGNSTNTNYGVYGFASDDLGTAYAVYAAGDLAYEDDLVNIFPSGMAPAAKDFSALDGVLRLKPQKWSSSIRSRGRESHTTGEFGFLAENFRKIFPEMVTPVEYHTPVQKNRLDSFETRQALAFKPLQLLPVLTKALQEEHTIVMEQGTRIRRLQQENQALRNRLTELETAVAKLLSEQEMSPKQEVAMLSDVRLDQNSPNPYRERTMISLYIPTSIQQAELRITDQQGKTIRTLQIGDRGTVSQWLDATNLSAGTYSYTLLLDGQMIATRQMLVVK